MFEGLAINVNFWVARFKEGLDFLIGVNGVLRGPFLLFLAISIVGLVLHEVVQIAGVLFGVRRSRTTQVSFGQAGSVWVSREDADRFLEWGQYQRVGRPVESSTYVSTDSDGRELSRVTVTRWSGD